MFTLQIAYEGTWVMVTDPEHVKQVFTGDPKVFHAGEGNQILRRFLGDNSVLVLDEKPHMSQRKLLLPPFHGERMQGYEEKMTEIAAREIDSWPPGHALQAAAADAGDHPGDHPRDRLRRPRGRADGASCATALRDFLDLTTNPRLLLPVLLVGPTGPGASPPFRRRIERVDALILARDRRAPRGRGPRASATTSSRCWSPPATRTAAR